MERLLRSINLLNIILAAAAVAAAHYIVLPRINKEMHFHLPAVKAAPAAAPAESRKQKAESEPAAQPIDSMLIADQNLFHPDRKIPAEIPAAPPLPPKPELLLYGTLITDGTRLAYIENINAPLTTPGRGKRLRVLRIGDMVGDFRLKEINPDIIVLSRGSEVMTVSLAESDAKRQKPTAAPTQETNPAGHRVPLPGPRR